MEHEEQINHDDADDNTSIWRYMDLPKFISMLDNIGLWFIKASTFKDDPYEGFSRPKYLKLPSEYKGHGALKLKTKKEEKIICIEEMIEIFSKKAAEYCENAQNHLYVNSWFLGEDESMAMWQIYGSQGCGIAVRSSVGQYKQSAHFKLSSEQYAFGKVKYHQLESSADTVRDFSNGPIPMPGSSMWKKVIPLGFHKRTCYEHENEWRAVLYQDPREEKGFFIQVDLEQLIKEIYVGPYAEKFILEVVRSIMSKYDLKKPVKHSDLLKKPWIRSQPIELRPE